MKASPFHSWLSRQRYQWPRQHAVLLVWIALLVGSLWLSELSRVPLINWNGGAVLSQFWLAMFRPALDGPFLSVIAQAVVT
ncbi:MAG: hypothetical protein AAGL17_19915, partial [Cyanobacteria bacterium J06576_12]